MSGPGSGLLDAAAALLGHKIPVGRWIKGLTDYATDNFVQGFDAVSATLSALIQGLTGLLLAPHLILFIGIAGALAGGLHRSLRLSVLVVLGLLLIFNLGYWRETMETVGLVLSATLVSLALGIPLGILAAQRRWIHAGLRPVLDLMQTIPSFVYLIPTLILFGLGVVPALISTAIFAIAAPIRLTCLGIRAVPPSLREAALAFGATPMQVLVKVELPHALPTIMAGVTQCIMLSLSMVVIAALVGADGLGKPVLRALNSVNIAMGFEAGLCIVVLAILLDRLLKHAEPGQG